MVYARRTAAGLPDVESAAAACTARTRAIVLVSPDNPLGVICPADVLEQIAALCKDRGLTLVIDHCLAGHVRLPLTVSRLGAGCFALVDVKGTGLDGESFARRLARERVLVSPASWFPSGTAEDETRVRVALSRSPATIGSLVTALNAVAR